MMTLALLATPVNLDWQPSVHSNTGTGTPNGTAVVDGSSIAMSINGGAAGPSNYLRLFSQPSTELAFPGAGEAIRFSVSGLSFDAELVGAAKSDQRLYFVLSPTPDEIPFKSGVSSGMQQGISLSIRADGVYSLGWTDGDPEDSGWLHTFNNLTGNVGGETIVGFDLTLFDDHYDLDIHTTGDLIGLSGQHGISDNWGNLGVSLTLHKLFGGGGEGINRLNAEINHLGLTAIPEPQTAVMILGGLVLAFMGSRRMKWNRNEV